MMLKIGPMLIDPVLHEYTIFINVHHAQSTLRACSRVEARKSQDSCF